MYFHRFGVDTLTFMGCTFDLFCLHVSGVRRKLEIRPRSLRALNALGRIRYYVKVSKSIETWRTTHRAYPTLARLLHQAVRDNFLHGAVDARMRLTISPKKVVSRANIPVVPPVVLPSQIDVEGAGKGGERDKCR